MKTLHVSPDVFDKMQRDMLIAEIAGFDGPLAALRNLGYEEIRLEKISVFVDLVGPKEHRLDDA